MDGWRAFLAWRLYVRNPVRLPGYIPADAPPKAQQLLRTLYAVELANLGHPGPLKRAVMVAAWAGLTAAACVINFLRYRPVIRREFPELGDLTHLRRLCISAFFNNIAPGEFYLLKFYVAKFYAQRRRYLLRWQSNTLLTHAIPADPARKLANKHRLWQVLSAAGLPAAPVWAFVHQGRWLEGNWDDTAARAVDLVIKPSNQSLGRGIAFLDRAPGGDWVLEGRRLNAAAARAAIEARSHTHPLLLQPRLDNHPAVAVYGTRGLVTLRIVTMKTRAMPAPVCVSAALRIPGVESRLAMGLASARDQDDFSRDAVACAINLATGRLGLGAGGAPAADDLQFHPTTQAPLAGQVLPHWAECRELCLAAHRLAPVLNSVGWDVALTPDGPKLLEANLRWGTRLLQLCQRIPILNTPFVEYYESAAAAAPARVSALPPPVSTLTPAVSLPPLAPAAGSPKWRRLESTRWGRRFIAWRLYVRNPVALPGFIPANASAQGQRLWRTLYACELEKLGQPGPLTRAVMVLSWAVVTAGACCTNFLAQRPALRREIPGLSDFTVLRRLLVSAFFNNIAPGEFYQFKFYLDRLYPRRRRTLLRWQLTTLLGNAAPTDASANLKDKYYFWRTLSRAGIATVPVLACVSAGRWVEGDWAAASAAGTDLVLKPTNLSRGDGIEFLDTAGADRWRLDDRPVTGAEARAHIEQRSHAHPVLLQPRMKNHPMLARYSTEGLATLRIVTMKNDRHPEPVCLVAALRIPSSNSRLASLYKQALITAIDLDTGILGFTSGVQPDCEDLRVHPANGAPIAGERLPYWEQCKALCLAGHRQAPSLNSIGWDVILVHDGPRLLEANILWGAHIIQMSRAIPLLDSRFPELYAFAPARA